VDVATPLKPRGGFGILFGTGIILLLIPALYLILEDFRRLFGLKDHHAGAPENP
jgi:hypothetical protein